MAEDPSISSIHDEILQAKVELTGKTAETLTLKVSTNKYTVVFIPEIYHRNWYAWVDSQKTPVIKAYASMRAVAVAPGEHEIVMKFVYLPFYCGLVIAMVFLLLMIIFMWRYNDKIDYFLGKKPTVPTKMKINLSV